MVVLKKNLFSIGLAFSVILGVAFSFLPQEVGAYVRIEESIDAVSVKCHHNANGSGSTNFCNGTRCEKSEGTGTRFSKCG